MPEELPGRKHSYYLYVVSHPKRDLIVAELKKREIFLSIHYPYPIHLMSGYQFLNYKEGDLPVTEKLAKEIFSLPLYPTLSDEKQAFVCNQIIEIMKENGWSD